ncbi:MAG: FAD-dependent thymidylate synthase, partial [Clostridia bacterium]|nr:FAD-dependent thymidylate synthase [Clostridia bacterium]
APEAALEAALAFSGRFPAEDGEYLTEKNMLALAKDARARELEALNYTFRIRDVSLAGITHFTRHRILSLMVPNAAEALAGGNYVLPASVAAREDIRALYEAAFAAQTAFAREMEAEGLPEEYLPYLALAGHTTDILMTANARELNHFLQLRTCRRAQWEIRGIARQMLTLLQNHADDIFWVYGPSCAVLGRCPEGKLSCGKPETRG